MAEPTIDYGRMLDVLGVEVELIVSTAHEARHDLVVAACPRFTLGEVVRHVGSVYRVAHRWIADGVEPAEWQREPAEGQSLTGYLEEGLRGLRGRLAGHDADDPCATWYPPQQHHGFWARRMMHETVVHRGDVQSAAGADPDPVADDIAVDGIDEVLTVWFEHRLAELGLAGNAPSSVLVDAGGRGWLATMDRERVGVSEAAGTAEELGAGATLSGSPMNVYLWLWGRLPNSPRFVQVDGDDDAVAQMWALLRLATR